MNVGYQKADDYTVSLKRIEFALERVKLRERERRGVKEEEEEEEGKERARGTEKDDGTVIERAERTNSKATL